MPQVLARLERSVDEERGARQQMEAKLAEQDESIDQLVRASLRARISSSKWRCNSVLDAFGHGR